MARMTSASTRHFGKVFDQISGEYDKHRPGYPDELITHACQSASLVSGDPVLEIGCGSGQLTKSLIERGYHVTALEPGQNLIALAEQKLKGLGAADFINETFEDVELPKGQFKAAFCASAFHWVDPDVSWRKTAELLAPDGVFALLQYFGLKEERTSRDLEMQLAALKNVAPEIAAAWPRYFELDEIIEGARKRRGNVSEIWAWLGNYDLARNDAGDLFGDVELAAVPEVIEQTAEQLTSVIRTISAYSRLSERQRADLEQAFKDIEAKLGRPIRSSIVTILVTARRG